MCAMHSVVCIENVFLLISFQFHLRYLDKKYKKIIGFIESDRVSKKKNEEKIQNIFCILLRYSILYICTKEQFESLRLQK